MLTNLTIKNFVLVDNSHLSLNDTFIAITGETGAGKSILLNALGLTLGERANRLAIREGEQKAEVLAEFDISRNPEAQAVLKELDLILDENPQSCYLRRIVRKNDVSKSWINGTACKLEQVKMLASSMIHIYGQHDSQLLLTRESQLKMFDQFANCTKLAIQASILFKKHSKLRLQLNQLLADGSDSASQLEYLRYQLEELEQLDVKHNEFDSLSKQQSVLRDSVELGQEYSHLNHLIDGEQSSITQLSQAAIAIIDGSKQGGETLANIRDLLAQSKVLVDEAAEQVRYTLESLDIGTVDVDYIEQRLSKIYKLSRKHEIEPNKVADLVDLWRDRMSDLEQFDETRSRLQQQITEVEQEFTNTSQLLHQKRLDSAEPFAESVNRHLAMLSMADSKLQVAIRALDFQNANRYGMSEVEFEICANASRTFLPLRRVASGGELSRVSLAIALTTSHNSAHLTMVFDEIDSGVGGQTAIGIGKLLSQLGQTQQVLCITHLAQVAALSQQQFRVVKNIDVHSSEVHITQLDSRQKVEEIARMTGGTLNSQQALSLAQQMIEN